MNALALVVTDKARIAAALRLAAAAAALSRPVAVLFDGDTVTALARTSAAPLLADALALGVRITACQTGLALAGIAADKLVAGIETGGMVGFLAEHSAAQLLLA